MRVVENHLTPAMRDRLGAPDVRLVVGAAFPAQSTFLSSSAGVLASLLKGCATEGSDVVLFKAGNKDVPEAVQSEQHFETFLRLLYGAGAEVSSEEQALALVELAAYYDAPGVLPPVDAFLAFLARDDPGGLLEYSKTYSSSCGKYLCACIDKAKLESYLQLASAHRLRRLMCVCLPLAWALDDPVRTTVSYGMPQSVLAAFFSMIGGKDDKSNCCLESCPDGVCEFLRRPQTTSPARAASSMCCPKRREAHLSEWRRASEQLERKLLGLGWGCT